jgi:hypothetical protein
MFASQQDIKEEEGSSLIPKSKKEEENIKEGQPELESQ